MDKGGACGVFLRYLRESIYPSKVYVVCVCVCVCSQEASKEGAAATEEEWVLSRGGQAAGSEVPPAGPPAQQDSKGSQTIDC